MSVRDGSGTITFDEFKNVFAASLGPDSIPFNFDCDWIRLYLGKKDRKKAGTHVLGCTSTALWTTRFTHDRAPQIMNSLS